MAANINNTTPEVAPDPSKEERGGTSQERIRELSSKVELTSKERDEQKALNEQVTRERDFYASFADVITTHPQAKDHKNDILAKVKTGLSVEDATFAVLGKAGKLGNVQTPPQVAGGSASTTINQETQKEVKDMTLAEKREALTKGLLDPNFRFTL